MAYETATLNGEVENANVSDLLAEVARLFDHTTAHSDSVELDFIRGAYLAERAEHAAFVRDDPDVPAEEIDGLASFARRVAEGDVQLEGYDPEVCRQASRLAVSAGVESETVPR